MDFARKQLEKYGWEEGKGLGKNEDGISRAVKPSLKFDNYGLGHDIGEEFTNNWWEKMFNKAAQNISVDIDNQEVKVKTKSNKTLGINNKRSFEDRKKHEYCSFIKTSKLSGNKLYDFDEVPRVCPVQSPESFQTLTDEELLAVCGGRTAHKGARHGLKLSGKLSRIEKQEKMLLKKMRKVSLSDSEKDESNTQKKLKKLKKQKDAEKCDSLEGGLQIGSLKKKKKQRKSVSFNETVTKIYTVDLDTSFESEVGSIRDENSNDPNLEQMASGSDEGIDLDNDNDNSNHSDNHKSFEVVQCKYSDLSKAERKKLKKKRKLEARKQTSTGIFLQRLRDEYNNEDDLLNEFEDKDRNLKKRKFFDESDQGDSKTGCSLSESPDKNRNKRNKKKKKKQRKLEEKQMNNIVKSFDICSISNNE